MDDERETERTTVVQTGRSSSGGTIAIVVILLLILLVLFMFRNEIFGAAKQVEKVDVEVTTTEGS